MPLFPPSACMHACSALKQAKPQTREIRARTLFKVYTLPPISHSHSSNLLYPANSHHMYTSHSLVRISHQLCSIRFYCNCKKFYHYDLFHVRQKNRSYEVCICWLRRKGHTHTQRATTKVHKNKRSMSMRVKKIEKKRF